LLFCFAALLSLTIVVAMTGYIVNHFSLTLKTFFKSYTGHCE
jgi:hypothetical protein